MKRFLMISGLCILMILALWAFFAWEVPLMDVLPQEAWTEVRVRGEAKEMQDKTLVWQWKTLDDELVPFLEALRATKVSRDNSPSSVLHMPYLEIRIHCALHEHPTLLYIQSNGDIAFAVHMDTDHYRRYEGGQALYDTLAALGLPVEK